MNILDEKSIPEPNSGCLLWLGGVQSSGYGQTSIGGRSYLVHRLAWERANGPLKAGQVVLHKCDVPLCINPQHLSAGTAADNMADKVMKGRQDKGESHGRAKLTEKEVLAIRADERPAKVVAAIYGVDRVHVSSIRARRFWRHI